jgi:glycosyltransferase involved in cell wall biosynthesis
VIINFVVSSSAHPVGGVTAQYEFANALSRRGHQVTIVHAPFFGLGIASLDDLSWFRFEPAIVHHLAEPGSIDFPPADIVFGTGARPEAGLPVHLVQGADVLFPQLEQEAFDQPGLKICIASWLRSVGERHGLAPEHLRVVHYGIDHERYRLITALDDRPLQVATLHHTHPAKGWPVARAALDEVRRQVPDLRVAVFGTSVPDEPLPAWMTFVHDPPQDVLVRSIYNQSRVYLQASDHEGFGFTAVEAMACGCALVTTDNGGSDDYAIPDETALLAAPRDAAGLAAQMVRLLRDDAERRRIAELGRRFVARFDWDRAGEALEAELEAYLADPDAYPGAELTGS